MIALARERSRKAVFPLLLAPLSAAVLLGPFALGGEPGTQSAALAFVAFSGGGLIVPLEAHWERFLPLMGRLLPAAGALAGLPLLALIQLTTGQPGLTSLELAAVSLLVAVVSAVPEAVFGRRRVPARPVRVAVIGSSRSAELLAGELLLAGIASHLVVGRVSCPGPKSCPPEPAPDIPTLGSLERLDAVIEMHELDLLVMTGEEDRERIFDAVVGSCMHLPVRLTQFSNFYEELFGHVPTGEMSSAWFEYMLHPRYRGGAPAPKRLLDVLVGSLLGLLLLPPLALLALLIRRDGGPALFRQTRIGEGGRPFTLYKLRTMRPEAQELAQWASADDPRITRIGHFLRRTHLDEVPQVLNVIRGEMSLIGPRPEQPEFVGRLEAIVPFYARRHLIRPGITGWAQVMCGYASSDVGSAWKLSHDLYYLKHRSVVFDVIILAETARKVFVDPHLHAEPESASFIVPVAQTTPYATAEVA